MTENQQPPTTQEELTSYGGKESGQKIRLRAIVLGALFALAICLITPFNNAYLSSPTPAAPTAPPSAAATACSTRARSAMRQPRLV